MQAPTPQIVQYRLNDLAHGANSTRLNPESQQWTTSGDPDYDIMDNELKDAYGSWRYGRHASEVLFHLENVKDRMKERLSDDYQLKYESSLAYFQRMLYVMIEWVDRTGDRFRTTMTYVDRASVASLVETYHACNYLEIAYGVKRIEPGVTWTIPPSQLVWVKTRPVTENMTMQTLFRDVPKADNERYYIVMSRLDVKTKHTNPTDRERVHNAVYWLKNLYPTLQGRLDSLRDLLVSP